MSSSAISTLSEAEAVAGKLSKPSKMPGYAYGIPAKACLTGALLAKIPNTVCSNCYALKGRYRFPNVASAQEKRLKSLGDPRWVEALVYMIQHYKNPWFRWHDSGDLQNLEHLDKIVEVARQLPWVHFWLPTREKLMVREWLRRHKSFPMNLTVRVSGAMIDGPPPPGFPNTSTVVSSSQTCPAPKQGNVCGHCRDCWDHKVPNVSYKEH